jgi:hypothetical protein
MISCTAVGSVSAIAVECGPDGDGSDMCTAGFIYASREYPYRVTLSNSELPS